MKAPQAINKNEGTGSVWNSNSYHWETKSVAGWSEEKLKSICSLFYAKQDNATLRIKEVKEVKGESTYCVRKGKKIVNYHYQIKLIWKVDISDDANTKVLESCEGEYFLPEVSNEVIDDGDEWDVEARVNNDTSQELK